MKKRISLLVAAILAVGVAAAIPATANASPAQARSVDGAFAYTYANHSIVTIAGGTAAFGAEPAGIKQCPKSVTDCYYGAFAYSPANHSIVAAAGGTTALGAETAAIEECGVSDCIPVAWFEHAYATLDTGAGDAWGWGYAATSQGADQNALNYCEKYGSQCHPVMRVLTPLPSSADQGSDLLGRACMINAPDGADFKLLGTYGHVGWAFLSDRVNGTWVFGADEGPSFKYLGAPSNTWISSGNWSTLVNTFTTAKDYHGAGYYETFRCSSSGSNNYLQAYNKALDLARNAYYVPGNDCLSNAVDILTAYGASGLGASDILHWSPNDYFNNQLSGWEPAKPLT